jgi:hypothetical protein
LEQPFIEGHEEWFQPELEAVHERTLAWLSALPYRLRLRINSIGEPFTSDAYLDSIAQFSHSKNLEFVEILTNGSFSDVRFERFVQHVCAERLRLWMTYHPSQIKLDRFIKAAVKAKSHHIPLVVHGLLFPDTVKEVFELKKRCAEEGLRLHIGLGINFNKAYPLHGHVPAAEDETVPREALELNIAFPDEIYQAAHRPFGSPCSAGHDYIFVDLWGNVHQCFTYHMNRMQPLGSTQDPNFQLSLRKTQFKKCAAKTSCVCVEDYQHLKCSKATFREDDVSFIPWSTSSFVTAPSK